tara:strand:+ start:128 stop:547 length:420 start_codon:yes stop_codon:yes gene_type:complete
VKKKISISEKDKKDWKDYIEDPKDLFNKDLNLKEKTRDNSRFKFDLHGYKLLEANQKVKEIILSCWKKKYSEILLVTGKGIHSNTDQDVYVSNELSKLKYSIPDYIKSDNDLFSKISSISKADPQDGGDGAIIVKLKKL